MFATSGGYEKGTKGGISKFFPRQKNSSSSNTFGSGLVFAEVKEHVCTDEGQQEVATSQGLRGTKEHSCYLWQAVMGYGSQVA